MLADRPPVVYGDGEQSRDFTFVRHVADATVLACESDMSGCFNVACGRRVTINELIRTINEILGKDIRPVYAAPRPGDVRHSMADISRARQWNYSPDVDFKEELKETIRSFVLCVN
jgi:UDP-glucose 4-epimerase